VVVVKERWAEAGSQRLRHYQEEFLGEENQTEGKMEDELDPDLRTTMNRPSSARPLPTEVFASASCPPWLSKGNLAYRHIAGLRRMSPRVVSSDI
jgi:hypothetical protein